MRTHAASALLLTFCLSLAPAASADVDSALKRKIISDCKEAEVDFQKLGDEQKRQLVPYLSRVLRLQPSAAPAPRAPQMGEPALHFEGVPLEPFSAFDASRSFDPLHEVQAKRCAVALIERMPTLALDSLPELAQLVSDPTAPNDLKSRALNVTRTIL